MPEQMDDALKAADRIIELTGGEIRLGLPLGLGKPNRLVNALSVSYTHLTLPTKA